MRGIVFGAGFLGTRIGEFFKYPAIPRSKVDVLNLSSLEEFLEYEKPEVVINALGKTGKPNIDWCEDNKESTMQSNVSAAINLCTESVKRGIYFVHLGSGCVYSGDNQGRGYTEEDEPNFYGHQFYADTKILAEKALKRFPCLQLRIRMPIDDRPHDRNLIDKLKKYPSVINMKNSMTTVPDMLLAMKALIERKETGVYNLVNPRMISALEIMKMYQEIVDENHKFEAMSLEELDKMTIAKRSNCYLNTDKLKKEGIIMPEIHEAVKFCLLNYKKNLK